MRFSSVLQTIVVWNLVQLSSSLSDECEFYTNQRQGLMPIQINCTIFLNGTLNIWWNLTNQHVDKVVSIDYNCTGIGDEQLYSFVSDVDASTAVDLLPSINNFAMVEPTCYVDGCYGWSIPRAKISTYIIPTVTCTGITFPSPSYDGSKDMTTKMTSIVTPPTSMLPVPNLEPTGMQGGLKQYIWFVFILVPGIALFLLTVALFLRWRRQKREWWCKGKNKDLLLGNEPCVDPLAYTESDYCESATIVDPLDIHEHGQNHLVTTTVICGESLFVEDLKQQAGDSDNHSLSRGSDTSESGSMPLESDGNGQPEKDNLSTCTQTVDHDAAVGAHPSDSEEERLLINTADNANLLNKGTKHNVKPIPTVLQNSLSSTTMKTLNKTCKDLLPSAKPATSEHAMPGGLTATSLGDKTHCTSNDGATWKFLCDSNDLSTPEYIPSSEHSVFSEKGTSLAVNSSDDDTETNKLMSAEEMTISSPVKDCHSKISISEKQAEPDASIFTNGVEQHMRKGVDDGKHHSNPNSPHNRQHQQEQQSRADYILSSDYSSSVYSSEQSAATTTDYLADIEDIADADQCSMQSGLAAVEDTPGRLESNSEEERINCHYPKPALLQDVTNCQLHLFLPDDGHHYCTMGNPAETPGSSSSGYVEVSPRQNQNTSVNNIYEVMIRQDEPSNSSHSGYLSTVYNKHTRNYQYETTV